MQEVVVGIELRKGGLRSIRCGLWIKSTHDDDKFSHAQARAPPMAKLDQQHHRDNMHMVCRS